MTTTNYVRQILLKRGTTAQSLTYTGPLGEVTLDTDLDTLRIHDGVTPGGKMINSSPTYGNANVASYLSHYDGGIHFAASPAVITGLGNISSANFTFGNGVNILSTVANIVSESGPIGNVTISNNLITLSNTARHQLLGNVYLGYFAPSGTANDSILTLNASSETPVLEQAMMHMNSGPVAGAKITMDSSINSSANISSSVTGRRSRGTSSAPSSVQAGDRIFSIAGRPWSYPSGYSTGAVNPAVSIDFHALENIQDATQGTYIELMTTPLGTNASAVAVNVNSRGTTVSGNVTVTGVFSAPPQTKAATAPGTPGQICWDSTYIYVCTATDTWKRCQLFGGY
jgi:hypothetical protein